MSENQPLISIVIPIYNESPNIAKLFKAINTAIVNIPLKTELIVVDDGSTDDSLKKLEELSAELSNIYVVALARNFGKEIALTAGLSHAKGDAAIMIDADLQHPPRFIPKFIEKWQNGADVVVGIRTRPGKVNFFRKFASKTFYTTMNKISSTPIIPHATDYRLLDRQVIDEFLRFTERSRIVRGLIDWLGFKRDYVHFAANKRHAGKPSYTNKKLFEFALASFVSMSQIPLRFAGYLGAIIVILSGPIGIFMLVNIYFYNNSFSFTGPAELGVLILFLIGITLINIGIMSIYIANIHSEVSNRPLYVIRRNRRKK